MNHAITLADQAKALALGLDIGVTTVDEVVAWADAAILSMESPPPSLCDVSLAMGRPLPDLSASLHRIGQAANLESSSSLLLRHALRSLRANTISGNALCDRVVELWLSRSLALIDGEIYRLTDEYAHVRAGRASRTDLDTDLEHLLEKFLSKYKSA